MRSARLAAILAAGMIVSVSSQASAGGWSGGDHSFYRKHFGQGFTLSRMWQRLDSR